MYPFDIVVIEIVLRKKGACLPITSRRHYHKSGHGIQTIFDVFIIN